MTRAVHHEALETWRQRREAAPCAVRVDWPLLLDATDLRVVRRGPVDSAAQSLVPSALRAFDELNPHRDPCTLMRLGVELARSRLALERVALLLLSSDGTELVGSWGTDAQGRTCDERHISFTLGQAHRDAFARAQSGVAHWLVLDNAPLIEQTATGARIIAYGWNALVPVRGRTGEAVGLVVCDSALTLRPVEAESLCAAAVFCALLGTRIEAARGEAELGTGDSPRLIARAISRLRDDPELTREALAAELGVSPGALGRRFKSDLGESLGEYRNRVKLERFVALAQSCGSNLLAAALDAGFGSYAQFHRVFRAHMGCSPKDYFRQRGGSAARREPHDEAGPAQDIRQLEIC